MAARPLDELDHEDGEPNAPKDGHNPARASDEGPAFVVLLAHGVTREIPKSAGTQATKGSNEELHHFGVHC